MAVEGLGGSGKGVAFLVSAGVMYEIIAAACSSPQTTELNAQARSATLMKWVHIGVAQGLLFVALAAFYDRKDAVPILVGGGLAAVLLYAQYTRARGRPRKRRTAHRELLMAQIQASSGQQEVILQYAAGRYDVPESILKGVYGVETNSGKNIATSSAGAMGAFQFLPSTAKSYGYPLTNNVNSSVLTQQATAAAHYLSDLYKRTGSWDAALKAYSGGGYGLAQVQAKSGASFPNNDFTGPVAGALNTASSVINAPADIASAIGGVWGSLTTPALWKRVLYFVGGAVLLFWGIKELTGAHLPEGVKHAAVAAAI
jgi:soluble lytic murein transglycosylase-like protein